MSKFMTFAKTKMRGIALAASGLVVAAMSLGTGAVASANSYSWSQDSYGGRGSYTRYDNNYQRNHNNNYNNRHYSRYQWVYDSYLHRWVLIGFNTYTHRWELVYHNDRYSSHTNNRWENRNGSYWYND